MIIMDLEQEILKEPSKSQALKIAHYIGNKQERFDALMHIFFHGPSRLTQRAAWILSHCADHHPHLLMPYIPALIDNLETDPPVAVKRNTVRVLQNMEIPEEKMGILAEQCFNFLNSAKEAIAVKVFSMTILANIAKKFPELKQEVILTIENQMPYGSAGFRSRGRKVLKDLGQ